VLHVENPSVSSTPLQKNWSCSSQRVTLPHSRDCGLCVRQALPDGFDSQHRLSRQYEQHSCRHTSVLLNTQLVWFCSLPVLCSACAHVGLIKDDTEINSMVSTSNAQANRLCRRAFAMFGHRKTGHTPRTMRATRTRRELCVYHGLAVYESTNTNIIQITRYNFPMSNKRIRVMAIGICPIVLSNYFIVLNTLEHLNYGDYPPHIF
jgi:hypothetical protein